MSERTRFGIPSQPVVLTDGAVKLSTEGSTPASQAVWFSIAQAQEWGGFNILGQETHGMQPPIEPYVEPADTPSLTDLIQSADADRAGTDRYTAARNLVSMTAFLGARPKDVIQEVRKQSILDVGSGEGKLGDDLRRYGKARVTEVDFSALALASAVPILGSRGARTVSDGTELPYRDGSFDTVTSMFSTFVHAPTIRSRLQGLTEAVRVTRPGGRIYAVPLFGLMMLRQQRWNMMQNDPNILDGLAEDEIAHFFATERQESAIDCAMFGLINSLMIDKIVEVTPVLKIEVEGGAQKDIVSAVIDVKAPLPRQEAVERIEAQTARFTA